MSIITSPRVLLDSGLPVAGYSDLLAAFNKQIYEYEVPPDTTGQTFRHVYLTAILTGVAGSPQFAAPFFPFIEGGVRKSVVDMSEVLKLLFGGLEAEFPNGVDTYINEVSLFKSVLIRLHPRYYVSGYGYTTLNVSPQPPIYGIMAAMQRGEKSNMLQYLCYQYDETSYSNAKLLTEMPHINRWSNNGSQLPSELQFVAKITEGEGGDPQLVFVTDGVVDIKVSEDTTFNTYQYKRVDAWMLPGLSAQVKYSGPDITLCSEKKFFKDRDVNYNAFHVRWLNRLGGVDYWCFEKRQRKAYSVGEVVTTQRYYDNIETAKRIDIVTKKVGRFGITAGASNVLPTEWPALTWLIYSPLVQVYRDGVWDDVIVDSKGSQLLTDDPRAEFELTFVYPEINTQY
jgi:hypothetical protein